MANHLNMELNAHILDDAAGMNFVDRMEWALEELRTSIHALETNNWVYCSYFHTFKEETKAWILRIHNDLTVDNAMPFLMTIPLAVRQDAETFQFLLGLVEWIHENNHLDIALEYLGVPGPTAVNPHLRARARRGD